MQTTQTTQQRVHTKKVNTKSKRKENEHKILMNINVINV